MAPSTPPPLAAATAAPRVLILEDVRGLVRVDKDISYTLIFFFVNSKFVMVWFPFPKGK